MTSLEDDHDLIREVSIAAGQIALSYFGEENQVWQKQGDSPVSEADFAVDHFLKETLLAKRPHYGWLSEETEDNSDRLGADRVFVVDPIDGTRGFLAGRKEWCVSIAIVEKNRPIVGVLECPALEQTFSAIAGGGGWLNSDRLSALTATTFRTITGSRKLNASIEKHPDNRLEVIPFIPSLAYRIAMVASGTIDAALARPGAQDWDLAASDLLLQEVGGALVDINGDEKRYNLANTRSGSLLASSKGTQKNLMKLAKSGGFLH